MACSGGDRTGVKLEKSKREVAHLWRPERRSQWGQPVAPGVKFSKKAMLVLLD